MPLTPDDIRNVQFGKPRFGQRGYDPEDVDRLLDDVEHVAHALRTNRPIGENHALSVAARAQCSWFCAVSRPTRSSSSTASAACSTITGTSLRSGAENGFST